MLRKKDFDALLMSRADVAERMKSAYAARKAEIQERQDREEREKKLADENQKLAAIKERDRLVRDMRRGSITPAAATSGPLTPLRTPGPKDSAEKEALLSSDRLGEPRSSRMSPIAKNSAPIANRIQRLSSAESEQGSKFVRRGSAPDIGRASSPKPGPTVDKDASSSNKTIDQAPADSNDAPEKPVPRQQPKLAKDSTSNRISKLRPLDIGKVGPEPQTDLIELEPQPPAPNSVAVGVGDDDFPPKGEPPPPEPLPLTSGAFPLTSEATDWQNLPNIQLDDGKPPIQVSPHDPAAPETT
jgi:hypothetical protein